MVVLDLIIACYVLWPGVPYRQQSWHTSQHAKPWRMWLGTMVTGALVVIPTLFLEGGTLTQQWDGDRVVRDITRKIIPCVSP